MFRTSLYLSLLLAAGWLAACSDHLNPAVTPGSTTTRMRVKALRLELPNGLARVSAFSYDGQGRLSGIKTYQTPDSTVAALETSVYQYDAQNRLTGLRRQAILYPRGNSFSPSESYTYSYNDAGQVTGLNYASGFSLTFAYNSANKLASSRRQFLFSGIDQFGTDSFTFTGDDLTKLNSTRTIPTRGPGGDFRSDVTFAYDDKVNPFYGVYVIPAPYPAGFVRLQSAPGTVETYFGGIENVLNLSPHNVLTKVSNGISTIGSTTNTSTSRSVYQYEYNTANLPTLLTTTTDNVLKETLRFEYESY
ncbi:hypothetical protein [Spirosoma utsteinense]|uniref:YD repeat-containing protein n=1 Tax=Spirosoma utsteinense TaxID=2585773 RepID=A0ABR6WAX5_9BACT|nr:hypothetical protein [Spirosoma utsteinense]MBC3785694.1 YD repeat-containing protein [Spirosoma utsteinense]MBC3793728.1 YD repeat-containing protein [Spirosoma utsteinense]